jgi:transglycosylase-like protein with SLT domain
MMPPSDDLLALARSAASKHALDPALVCAVVEQESAWDSHAIRYEPSFRTRYVAPLGLPPTEEIARSISWGLMQVMGQVAREHGFQGKFLSALCEPAAGLDIGCAVLAAKIASVEASCRNAENVAQVFRPEGSSAQGQGIAADEIARALQLWNGGANANYASQVLARLPHYR